MQQTNKNPILLLSSLQTMGSNKFQSFGNYDALVVSESSKFIILFSIICGFPDDTGRNIFDILTFQILQLKSS